jgi:very-short-patch-repair endonuclease
MLTPADHELFAFAASNDSVFTLADAAAAGLTEPEIRRRAAHLWERVHAGVFRVPGAAPSWQGGLRAAVLAAGERAAASHRSAAGVFELPGARRDFVEITCVRWERATRPGMVVHESRRLGVEDLQLVNGITVTRPERVILDLASVYPSADFLEKVIHAARRKRLITHSSTRAMFDRHARRGLRGVKALRIALDRWSPNDRPSESDMETLLLQILRRHGLPDPVLQHEVRDASGALVARVDAAYPQARIAIEYDSIQEHSDEFQLAKDARRRNALSAAGYRTLAARRADLVNGGQIFCTQVEAALRLQPALNSGALALKSTPVRFRAS